MFPNFCFTKAGTNNDLQVVQRNYVPKASKQSVRHSGRYEARPTNSYLLRAALRGHDANNTMRENNGKQVKRLRKTRKTVKKAAPEPAYKQEEPTVKPRNTRSIEFCLPPTPIHDKRQSSVGEPNAAMADHQQREHAGQATQAEHPEQLEEHESSTSIDPNRELQESCADFFNIVHDNVLEAVQGAVERMVRKYFQDTVKRMELLAAKLARQELLMSKIHQDLTNRMNEQQESSINQFKFIAQMLIDSQTVHYRALNSSQKRKRFKSENTTVHSPSSTTSTHEDIRVTAGKNEQVAKHQQHQQQMQQPLQLQQPPTKQHQLRQQQDLTNSPNYLCQQCTARKSSATAATAAESTAATAPTAYSQAPAGNTPKRARKFRKSGTISMPNLHRSKSCAHPQSNSMQTVILPVCMRKPSQQKQRTSGTHVHSSTLCKAQTPTRSSLATPKYSYQAHLQRDSERELRSSKVSLMQQRACHRYVRARPSADYLNRANESFA